MPILKAMQTPFSGDLQAIVDECACESAPRREEALGSLENWRLEVGHSSDVRKPEYFQLTALAVGVLVAAPTADLDCSSQFNKINANVGNFWNCCDNIIHKAGGFQSTQLKDLKTTLRGIENLWFERDVELLREDSDPRGVLVQRLREIELKIESRNVMAEIFVNCAGWAL